MYVCICTYVYIGKIEGGDEKMLVLKYFHLSKYFQTPGAESGRQLLTTEWRIRTSLPDRSDRFEVLVNSAEYLR